jgi:dihydropteroate synthase
MTAEDIPVNIMGILNVTPDSFSDGGRFLDAAKAVRHAEKMVREGADIIDIGGESTRPGAAPVPLQEELDRVMPVLEKLAELDVKVSVDTTKPALAEEALKRGATIVNDVSGLRDGPRLAELAARYNAELVIMHMKGSPGTMQRSPHYEDAVSEIYGYLEEKMRLAVGAGLPKARIILDPGIGFGKRLEDNIAVFRHLRRFRDTGCRVMIGASRKSMIAGILPAEPGERLPGSLILAAVAVLRGASILRVHDVRETVQALKVLKSVW